MKTIRLLGLLAGFLLALTLSVPAAASQDVTAPVTQFFAKRGGLSLRAIIYRPQGWRPREQRAAVVIFNGLGWKQGQPDWSEPLAKHYASKGVIAICAQYRLAQGNITPLDQIADASDAIRWVRANAAALSVDPGRIAAHGLSAGGHLVLSAAQFSGNSSVSPIPNALILYSPLLDIETNLELQQMLGTKATAASISPILKIGPKQPPTLILQGDVDTVAPYSSAERFCEKMKEVGNRCELNRYMYMGHLFTPKGTPDNGTPKPDPRVEAAALVKVDEFLMSLGYLGK